MQRSVLTSGGGGELYLDTVKSGRARTVPFVAELVPIVDRWAEGKTAGDWLFRHRRRADSGVRLEALRPLDRRPRGMASQPCVFTISATRRRRSGWAMALTPKVVQRVVEHATAAMTMNLYGHLLDANLWAAARRIGDTSGTSGAPDATDDGESAEGQARDMRFCVEPSDGIEPSTYALRRRRSFAHNAMTSTGRTPQRTRCTR